MLRKIIGIVAFFVATNIAIMVLFFLSNQSHQKEMARLLAQQAHNTVSGGRQPGQQDPPPYI